jgi:hypothetical protein
LVEEHDTIVCWIKEDGVRVRCLASGSAMQEYNGLAIPFAVLFVMQPMDIGDLEITRVEG